MVDEKYIKKILSSLETVERNKILDALQKERYHMDGWAQLSKIPIGFLAKGFLRKPAARTSFLKKVCILYFSTDDLDELNDILDAPLEAEKVAGYLAALALREEDDSDLADELVDDEYAFEEKTEKIFDVVGKDVVVKDSKEKKCMKLLGYIRMVQGERWDYFNFYPIMEMDEEGVLSPIYNPIEQFPQKGNIFLYCRKPDSNLLYDNFLDQNHYVLNISEDDLEPNQNETGLKVNVENLIYGKKCSQISDCDIYYIAEPKNKAQSLDFSVDIPVEDETYFPDDIVLLKMGNRLIGPFKLVENEKTHELVIRAQPDKCNYLFNTYVYKQDDMEEAILHLKSYKSSTREEIKKRAIQLDDNFDISIEDYITLPILLERLNAYLSTTGAYSEGLAQKVEELKKDTTYKSSILVKDDLKATSTRLEAIEAFLKEADTLETSTINIIELLKNILKRNSERGNEEFSLILDAIKEDKQLLSLVMPKYASLIEECEELDRKIAELSERAQEIEKEKIQEIYEQQKQLTEEVARLKEERDALDQKLSEAREKISYVDEIQKLEWKVDDLRRENQQLEDKKEKQLKEIEQAIGSMFGGDDLSLEIAKSIKEDGISQAIIDASAKIANEKVDANEIRHLAVLESRQFNKLTGEALIEEIVEKIQKYRKYSRNEILNILLCYSQGFLTVFSGEPGTGKTSICNILSHVLGLDCLSTPQDEENYNRFITVAVERGWTSKRDLIGYYNPLTKTFDSNNSHVYSALRILNREAKAKRAVYPLIILLDEANLSPMEYYWADFMNLCDDWTEQSNISLGNNEVCYIPETLRFLATINNDHTTEMLSPRLVDRAWVITLPSCQEGTSTDLIFDDKPSIVPFKAINIALNERNVEFTGRIKRILEAVYNKFKKNNISISPRIDKAIRKYCSVAQGWFDEEESSIDLNALDYAIAQKLLPKINGNGGNYRKFLNELSELFIQEKLNHSSDILNRIIQKGDSMMDYYKFF